jgi:threonine dehydrogenase-like Zn-dependent dehydrogenase
MRLYGSASCDPHINGGFEEFVLAPAANAFAIPEALSWGEAAKAEPLSVAAHAAGRTDSLAGQTVLVTGGGAIELRVSGQIDVKPLITSVYSLAELGAAMQTAINAPQGIKVQIAA